MSYRPPKSRKRSYMARRAAVRDSKRAYRARFIRPQLLSEFRGGTFPPPRSRVPKSEAERLRYDDDEAEAAVTEGETVDLVSSDDDDGQPMNPELVDLVSSGDEEIAVATEKPCDGPSPWPSEVVRVPHAEFPPDIKLRDVGAVDWCGCEELCHVEPCHNAVTDIFCSSNNCRVGPRCGNHRRDFGGLELRTGSVGSTVFTTKDIPYGQVIGEHSGEVTNFNYAETEEQREYTMALATGSLASLTIRAHQTACSSRLTTDASLLFFCTPSKTFRQGPRYAQAMGRSCGLCASAARPTVCHCKMVRSQAKQ
jgi:hypothetical protein